MKCFIAQSGPGWPSDYTRNKLEAGLTLLILLVVTPLAASTEHLILLDTSGLLSALFPDQYRHEDCAPILRESDPPRILSPFVLAEADYLIHKYGGVAAEGLFLEDVARGAYELADFRPADVDEARKLVSKYASLRIGLADASIAVLAARYETLDLLTLDERHFRAIRPMPRKNFRILPADA